MKTLSKIIAIAFLSLGSLNAKTGGGGFSSSSRSSSSSSSTRPSSPSPSRPSSSWSSSSSKPSTPSVAPSKPTSSWGSSSSSSKPSSPSTNSWGSSSSSSKPNSTASSSTGTASKSTWGLTKPQTSTRPNSSVERQRYESAVKSGKTFSTREAAVADFKAKEASKYSSRFTVEPPTRPAYIPQTYSNHTIIYNQGGGGYGYWSGNGPGLGTFMLYNLAEDAMMMETVARRSNNYYIGNPPPAYVEVETGHSVGFLGWFLIVICVGVIGLVFVSILKNL